MATRAKKTTKKAKTKPGRRDVPEQRLRLFVEAYTRNPNGAAAAKAAGYTGSVKARSEQATRLLERDDVKAMIAEATKQVHEARPGIMTRDERQELWSQIARGELTAPVVVGDHVEDMAPPWAMRLKASELLGKAQGDFIERVEHTHGGRVEFIVEVPQREVLPEPEE